MDKINQNFETAKKRIETIKEALEVLSNLQCNVGIVSISVDKTTLEMLSKHYGEILLNPNGINGSEFIIIESGNLDTFKYEIVVDSNVPSELFETLAKAFNPAA